MPIEIREIVTEVVVRGADEPTPAGAPAAPALDPLALQAQRDEVVRQAVERVLDLLRREWER
jgi:hypothetical protein